MAYIANAKSGVNVGDRLQGCRTENTLCSKNSDAKIQITITNLPELNILLAALIIIFPV